MNSLDLKYAKSLILRLNEKETYRKSELFDVVTSNQVLDKLLDAMEKDGYLSKRLSTYGRRTYSIALTPRGRAVARQLKIAEDIASGRAIPETEITLQVPKGLYGDIVETVRKKRKWKSVDEFMMDAAREKIERLEKEGKG